MAFPPIQLLLALRPQEETPSRTPLWLILLRMLLAILIILGIAHPLINSSDGLRGSGPLILFVDNGWASSADWPARSDMMIGLINQAARDNRPVYLMATAPTQPDKPPEASELLRPGDALRQARAIQPVPWAVDHVAAVAAIEAIPIEGSAHVVWLSNGLAAERTGELATRLQRLGSLTVYTDPVSTRARLIRPPETEGDTMTVPVLRPGTGAVAANQQQFLRAVADGGRLIAREPIVFQEGTQAGTATLTLPGELRNDVTRLEIEGATTAGASFLIDERWRRRPVGLVSGESTEASQPLLSALYYLTRALRPFAEVRQGQLEKLLERELAVLVMADIGQLTEGQIETVDAWVRRGGVVVRFAGPRLAGNADELIPVRLRGGGRALGGAMSWSQPAQLAPFDEASPFADLEVPGDVRIRRQVLAEPSPELEDLTWAQLTDGTPLVTAQKREQGWLILYHTTANTTWSNLPISGLFVDMLRRIVGLSLGVVSEDANAVLPPVETMDGFGRLGPPPSTASPVPSGEFAETTIGPSSPPGYYGQSDARRALNLGARIEKLELLGDLPSGVEQAGYSREPALDLKPWLLLAALILAIVDLLIAFALRGLFARRTLAKTITPAAIVLLAVTIGMPALTGSALAQGMINTQPTGPDAPALSATLETRLAYVRTGNSRIDEVSRAGLRGLSAILRKRTAVEPGEPIGVDIEQDELAFFPLMYWAVSPNQRPPSDKARRKLNQYLTSGGTILFDTREQGSLSGSRFSGGGAAGQRLRLLLRGLDIPTLTPVPRDHVLTKSFYLLNDFQGRWAGGQLWVERRGGQHNDGVSSVIIGSNDFAGAWAVDEFGQPSMAVVPGGELQREQAYRFGVNWVMYALTGNYKTDQVHVPAIIERIGQ